MNLFLNRDAACERALKAFEHGGDIVRRDTAPGRLLRAFGAGGAGTADSLPQAQYDTTGTAVVDPSRSTGLSILDWHNASQYESALGRGADAAEQKDSAGWIPPPTLTFRRPATGLRDGQTVVFDPQKEVAVLRKKFEEDLAALRHELYSQVDTLRREIAHARDYSASGHDRTTATNDRLGKVEAKLSRLGSTLRGDDTIKSQSALSQTGP